MTSLVVNAAAFVVLGCVAVLVATVLWKVALEGPGGIRKFRKMGYGVSSYARADLKKQGGGSTIDVIEGLELMADKDRLQSMRQTRTISGEIA
jgi:hypothetical protein